MNIQVTYSSNRFTINNSQISAFSFSSDIENIFTEGKLVLIDTEGYMYNKLLPGEILVFKFLDEVTGEVLREYNMGILSIKRASSEEDPSVINSIEIRLINYIFFSQQNKTTAVKGNIASVISDTLSKASYLNIPRKYIEDSTDEASIRYRLSCNDFEFIKMLQKYAIREDSPMYAYFNEDSSFNFKSWTSMIANKSGCTLTPLKGTEGVVVSGGYVLPVYAFDIRDNLEQNATYKEYSFTTRHAIYNLPKGVEIDSINSSQELIAKNLEKIHVEDYKWYINPNDAKGIALHNSYSKDFESHKVSVVVDSCIGTNIKIGNSLKIQMPSLQEKVLSGEYVVKKSEEIWTTDVSLCKLVLTRI